MTCPKPSHRLQAPMGLLKVKSSGLGSGKVIPSRSKRSEKAQASAVTVGKPDFARAVPFKKGRFDGIENAGIEIAFVVGCGRDQAVHDEPPRIGIRSDGIGDGVGGPKRP